MRIAIALDESLGAGYLANASACIASGLFYGEEELLGPAIEGEGVTFIPITKVPILVVKRHKKDWEELLRRAQKNGLKHMVFTREGQSTTSYEEYAERVKGRGLQDVEVIGIGVLGEGDAVKKFCGDLPLLR